MQWRSPLVCSSLTPSVTRGNPSLEEKYGKIDHFSMSDGFPRVTDNTRIARTAAAAARAAPRPLLRAPCDARARVCAGACVSYAPPTRARGT